MKEQPRTTEVVYTWPDGREEVRYRRPYGSETAQHFINEVARLHEANPDSPYSIRHVARDTVRGEQLYSENGQGIKVLLPHVHWRTCAAIRSAIERAFPGWDVEVVNHPKDDISPSVSSAIFIDNDPQCYVPNPHHADFEPIIIEIVNRVVPGAF